MTVTFRLTDDVDDGRPAIVGTATLADLDDHFGWLAALKDLRAFGKAHPETIDHRAITPKKFLLDPTQSSWWANSTEPAVEFLIEPCTDDIVYEPTWNTLRGKLRHEYQERPPVAYAMDLGGYERWGREQSLVHREGEPGMSFVRNSTIHRLEPLVADAVMAIGYAEVATILRQTAARKVLDPVGGG